MVQAQRPKETGWSWRTNAQHREVGSSVRVIAARNGRKDIEIPIWSSNAFNVEREYGAVKPNRKTRCESNLGGPVGFKSVLPGEARLADVPRHWNEAWTAIRNLDREAGRRHDGRHE